MSIESRRSICRCVSEQQLRRLDQSSFAIGKRKFIGGQDSFFFVPFYLLWYDISRKALPVVDYECPTVSRPRDYMLPTILVDFAQHTVYQLWES